MICVSDFIPAPRYYLTNLVVPDLTFEVRASHILDFGSEHIKNDCVIVLIIIGIWCKGSNARSKEVSLPKFEDWKLLSVVVVYSNTYSNLELGLRVETTVRSVSEKCT